jgi:phosphoribosylglycinamide formyltransferase-1
LKEIRLGVLVSGSGTILEAMLAAGLDVSYVAADRQCRALEIAASNSIEAQLVDRHDFGGFGARFDREEYSRALTRHLVDARVDLVAMAGFGTITTNVFHEAFPQRVLNTHPSLLPAFKGWHAVREALNAGASVTGCTVHVATVELDHGPILAQRAVPVLAGDSEESLHERIKLVERELYPVVIEAALAALREGRPLAEVRVE